LSNEAPQIRIIATTVNRVRELNLFNIVENKRIPAKNISADKLMGIASFPAQFTASTIVNKLQVKIKK
jgi:hypothetical protein